MSVLVYTENWDGKFKKLTFELVSYARSVANQEGTNVVALSVGPAAEEELKNLATYGADKIIAIEDEQYASGLENQLYTAAIAEVAQKEDASVIVMAHNNTGKALAPRLSVRLKAGLASGVTALPETDGGFRVKKNAFSGKAPATVKINTPVKVLTLAQNSFGFNEDPKTGEIERYSPALDIQPKTSITDRDKVTGKILLSDAEVVVSGGRGMRGPEFWQPLEELAGVLGGATACSRPVSDEGWRPHEEHTGQTGKVIAPDLYFAFGISGAIQHVAGVSASKCIVAVNKDKDAPIFESADYGIVGDVHKVLPKLIEEVKRVKAE